jgi:exodeoxyribonuclease VII large subunit
MRGAIDTQISSFRERMVGLLTSYSFNRPRDLVREFSQRVDEIDRSLGVSFNHIARTTHQRYDALRHQLQALNPHGILRRGYSIVRKENRIVSSVHLLHSGDEAEIQFHDGTIGVQVEKGK